MQTDQCKAQANSVRFNVQKSDLQRLLESQECIFHGQEMLSRHEVNPSKPCICGRPVILERQRGN